MTNRLTQLTIKPSMAWLLVFVPALSYFVATRLSSSGFRWGRSNSLGDTVTSSLQLIGGSSSCSLLSKEIFFTSQVCEDVTVRADQRVSLQNTLNLLVQGRGMKQIVASAWRHDEELGRGYLLFSQAYGNGRIWRWEVGGGPIAIGRSLHLESSGCRSSQYHQCKKDQDQPNNNVGSGGLAIDFHHGSESDRYLEGSLVVAEWGEGRIVRMEESNGARTPLMIQVPDLCAISSSSSSSSSWRRLHQPKSLLYTPYGDLLVADTAPNCARSGIFRLSQAVHVPALESLSHSREAHSWNQTQHSFLIDTFYHQKVQQIGGMSMDPTWLNLMATVLDEHGRVLLVRIPLVVEEEEEEEEEEEDKDSDAESTSDEDKVEQDEDKIESTTQESSDEVSDGPKGLMDNKVKVLMDLSNELGVSQPGQLVVSERGHVFLAVPDGVAIISSTTDQVLGMLQMPQQPTSLTLGEDKFLYAFSDESVFRIRVRVGPISVPTNLVVGKKSS